MNNEQVMKLMADNGMHEGGMDNWVPDNAWVKFANLVEAAARADEREECAKFVDHILKEGGGTYGDALRARGTR